MSNMEGAVIRSRASLACVFAGTSLLALSVPMSAAADVLQIDGQASHWVAGGPVEAVVETDVQVAGSNRVPAAYAGTVTYLSTRYDLSPALIEALVWQESRWRQQAVSPKGARGLAQLMPATARELGVDPDDPLANLEGGARYLRAQLDRFDGDLEKALAAYNAGPGRVERAGGIPRIRETQDYVAAIMSRLSTYSRSEK
mgnify:CR=1 FL=1